MVDIDSRIQRAIADLTGNEALLGMLDTDAATAMLDWGVKMSTSIVNETDGLDEILADLTLLPRLKAVRSSMRSIGNWAAGKYIAPVDRTGLRDKLLAHFRIILGENSQLPATEEMDDLINQVDDKVNTPHQLVMKMMQLIANENKGEQ